MPILDIGGQRVTVGDDFLKLAPDQQQATVDEIALTLKPAAKAESTFDRNDPRFTGGGLMSAKVLEGVPVLGGLVPQAGAALSALAQPLTGVGAPGTSISERYTKNLEDEKASLKTADVEQPILSTALKVGGGIAGTVPLIAAAPAAFGAAGAGLLPSMAAGATSGAALGAADAAVRGEDIGRGAMFGSGGGAAGPAIGRAVGAVASKVLAKPEKLAPTTDDLYSAADKGFDAVRTSGVQIKPAAITSLAQKVRGDLHDEGLREYLAPKTFAALKELETPVGGAPTATATEAEKALGELVARGVQPERAKAAVAGLSGAEATPAGATFADLHGMRRVLGKAAGSPDPTERMAASRAIRELDDYLGNIPKEHVLAGDAAEASAKFKDALGNYAAAKRSDTLAGKLEAADLQAATANSGQNIDNAIRQRVKDILKSPKLLRGFSQDEKLQMQRVARGTAPGNIVRAVGNLLGGGGGLGALVSGGAGFAAAGPAGVAAPVAGYALKKVGNALTARQAAKLDEMIRSRAPAAKITLLENQLTRATNATQRAQLQRMIATIASAAGQSRIQPQREQALPVPIQ